MGMLEITNRIQDLDTRIRKIEGDIPSDQMVNASEIIELRKDLNYVQHLIIEQSSLPVDGSITGYEPPYVEDERPCVTDERPDQNMNPYQNQGQPIVGVIDGVIDVGSIPRPIRRDTSSIGKPTYKPNQDTYDHNKSKQRKTLITEANLGKTVLSLVAAVLIIAATSMFVSLVWDKIPDLVKGFGVLLIGIITYAIGLVLYDKKGLLTYLGIAATGSGIAFLGIIASTLIFKVCSPQIGIALVVAWTICGVLGYKRYPKLVLLIITDIGIIASVWTITYQDLGVNSLVAAILAGLISLLPIVLGRLLKVDTERESLMYPISLGTAVLCITMSISTVRDSGGIINFGIGLSESTLLVSGIFLAVLMAIILDTNSKLPRVVGHIVSIIEIQVLLSVLIYSTEIVVANKLIVAVIYLAVYAIPYFKRSNITKYFCYTTLNITYVAGLVLGALLVNTDTYLVDAMAVAIITLVYFVMTFGFVDKVDQYRWQKVAAKAAVLIGFLNCVLHTTIRLDSTVSLFAHIIYGFIVCGVMYDHVANRETNKSIINLNDIEQCLMDLTVYLLFNSMSYGVVFFSLYLVATNLLLNDRLGRVYSVACWANMAYVTNLILTVYSFSEIGKFELRTTIALSIVIVTTYMIIRIVRDRNSSRKVMQLLSAIYCLSIASLLGWVIFEHGYMASFIGVLEASLLLLLGIKINAKWLRLTSLVYLLLYIVTFIYSISGSGGTIGNALTLLISGVVVFGIGLGYSKLEAKLKLVDSDEGDQ